jgi:molybdopterin-guanine dinucleotide biosynthesis protein A
MVFDYCKTAILKKNTTNKGIAEKHPISLQKDHNSKAGLTPMESLFSGMAAGASSAVCTYPLDLARAQLAVLRGVKKKKDATKVEVVDVTQPKRRKGLGYVWSKSFKQGVRFLIYFDIWNDLLANSITISNVL